MFIFPLDPSELFAERAPQMKSWGIPARTVNAVRMAVTDAWVDGPGGWVYEWMQQAKLAEKAGNWLEAAHCYGAAKFPAVCTSAREQAYRSQLNAYLRASARFPCRFERTTVHVQYRECAIPVAVHLFERRSRKSRPLVCLTGGVDTLKMELHRLALALAIFGNFKVAVMDMPGTGESTVPLQPDAEIIYGGVIERLRDPHAKTALVGISFGGHWAAKLALMGAVDAAIDIGGPTGSAPADGAFLAALPNGMTGIVANAMRLDHLPSEAEASLLLSSFSLREQGWLDHAPQGQLLVVNGDKDPYIAIADTLCFESMQNASVWLVKDGHHCAGEQFSRVMPSAIAWLRTKLHGASLVNTALGKFSHFVMPSVSNLGKGV